MKLILDGTRQPIETAASTPTPGDVQPSALEAALTVTDLDRPSVRYLCFLIGATLYLLPFMRLLLQSPPEGLLIYGAVRIVHGQVFARDFFEVVGPGSFYWLALFFRLFGITFFATRVCLFVTTLITGLTMYFLSRQICSRYVALPCVLLVGTCFGTLWPTISHHVDSNNLALLSIASMIAWQRRRMLLFIYAAGALAGLTTCFLQQKGILLQLAIIVWLWMRRRDNPRTVRTLAALAVGYAAVIAIVLGYFWIKRSLWDLCYANVLWPIKHYSAINVVPYAHGLVRDCWSHFVLTKSGFGWTVVTASVLIAPYLLVVGIPVLLPALSLPFRKRSVRPEVSLYWLCGAAIWLAEIHRKDVFHLVFGAPLLLILFVYYLEQYRAKVADLVLQSLLICATCLAGFNLLLALTAHPVATRVGSVALFKSIRGLSALQARVHPGDEIFAYPYCPMYYFLSETTNPTRYGGLLYNFNTPEQFTESVSVLEKRRVRYVLWDTHFQAKEMNAIFPASARALTGSLIMEPYLESHYKVVWADENTRLMERLGEEHAD